MPAILLIIISSPGLSYDLSPGTHFVLHARFAWLSQYVCLWRHTRYDVTHVTTCIYKASATTQIMLNELSRWQWNRCCIDIFNESKTNRTPFKPQLHVFCQLLWHLYIHYLSTETNNSNYLEIFKKLEAVNLHSNSSNNCNRETPIWLIPAKHSLKCTFLNKYWMTSF